MTIKTHVTLGALEIVRAQARNDGESPGYVRMGAVPGFTACGMGLRGRYSPDVISLVMRFGGRLLWRRQRFQGSVETRQIPRISCPMCGVAWDAAHEGREWQFQPKENK